MQLEAVLKRSNMTTRQRISANPPKESDLRNGPHNIRLLEILIAHVSSFFPELRWSMKFGCATAAEYARGDTFINWIGLDRLGMSWFGRLRFLKITRTKEENTGQQGWCLSLAVFVFGDFTIFTVLVLAVSETALPFLVKQSQGQQKLWRDMKGPLPVICYTWRVHQFETLCSHSRPLTTHEGGKKPNDQQLQFNFILIGW